MAVNILPNRFTQQPQQVPSIRNANQNGSGIIFAALPGAGGRFIDMLNVVATNTVTGTPTASAGLGGIAVEFGGSSKIDATINGSNSFTTGFTVTAVFVPKNSSVKGTIVSVGGAANTFQIARNSSNGIAVDKQQAANIFSTGSLGLTAGILATLSISFIDNTRYACSVNGRIVASGVYNWGADSGNLIILGGRAGDSSEAFTGSILGAFVHNYAVADAQLNELSLNPWQVLAPPRRKLAAALSGITFDAASNSGYQAASSSYTFSRTVTGANTFLGVDVALLSAGQTVTSIIDDFGGANVAMSLIGAQTTVTSFGRIENWGLANPAAGTKTIQVNLSGSISSTALATSYTGVHQGSPTEAFNSAQATNVGAADASVAVTSIADNCWIHAAVATGDSSITANQTSRNNVTGVGGSGASEDNNGPKTPAGAVTMSFTGIGAAMTWAIGGYAIRPLAASGTNTAVNPGAGTLSITGLAPTVVQSNNQAVAPGAGILAITGLAPSVTQSNNISAAPGTGTLTITGFAPTISQPQTAAPGAGTLTITGFAPSVTQAINQAVNPGAGTLTISGFAPAITQSANQNINPGVGALALTGFAPAVAQSANQFIAPGAGTMVITGYAPTVTQATGSPNLTPGAGTVTLSGYAPAVAQAAAPRDPRFARPVTDVSAGSWLPSVPGATLASMIDEPAADSSDYDYTTVASTCEIALNAVTDPLTSANQVVRYQVWSPQGNGITVSMMQGSTVIASWSHSTLPPTPTIYAQALTGPQCDAITNYADLRFKFTAA